MTTAAAALAWQHTSGIAVPGCGAESGCAALSASRFGSLLGWPVSHLGTAYFAGLILAWLAAGRRPDVSVWLKRAVRLGAAGSVFFLAVMILEGHLCPYCTIVHAGNLAFWGSARDNSREKRSGNCPRAGEAARGIRRSWRV